MLPWYQNACNALLGLCSLKCSERHPLSDTTVLLRHVLLTPSTPCSPPPLPATLLALGVYLLYCEHTSYQRTPLFEDFFLILWVVILNINTLYFAGLLSTCM